MKIKPFKEHQDTLFTDYAMQIFNAHTSNDSHQNLNLLMDSYKTEAIESPAFLPGVIFGSMIHMYIMIQMIAEFREQETEEAIRFYNDMYNQSRKRLAKMLGNRPEYANELMRQFIEQFGEGNID